MPVDRPLAEDLAENVVTLYQQAETRLAADLARRLASGMGSPTWAQDKLRGLATLRQFSQNLVGRLNGAMADEIAQSVILAYVRGGNSALDDLGRAQSTHPEWLRAAGINNPNDRLRAMIERRQAGVAAQLAQARRALPGADAIARLAFSLTTQLQGTHLRIARWQLDSYREVIAAGSAPDVLLGLSTRRRASQIAWENLLGQGITGFVDRSGRGWNLASYVEMATRATVGQAAVEGHLDRLSAAGLDLVIVSNAPQECERCRPWEGKILARSGPPGRRTIQVEHATRDGVMVDVEIAGTVTEAIAAGLMHPNCRHSFSGYMAGVTRIPTNTEDPEGDKARQRLRALERKVRGQKLKAENTIDPAAKAGLEAKVRATQGQIREHVKATGLHRQPTREQIDLGHRPPPGPVASTPLAPPPAPTPPPPAPAPEPPPTPAAKKATPAKKAPAKAAKKAAKATPAKKAPPTKAAKKTAPRKTTPPPPRKATKAAAPAAPAPSTPPSPPVRINPVVDRVPIADDMTPEQTQRIREMLSLQADIAPAAVARLRGVAHFTDQQLARLPAGTAGAYDDTSIRMLLVRDAFTPGMREAANRCVASRFWTTVPEALRGGEQIVAHEFGHHIEAFIGQWNVAGRQRIGTLWTDVAHELRLPPPPVRADGLLFDRDLEPWFEQHKQTFANLVSTYGAKNGAECIAEVWSEYSTMGENARPFIRFFGGKLKELMEGLT